MAMPTPPLQPLGRRKMLADLFGKASVGTQAEKQAQAYLEKQGLTFKERNFRCRQGEIDLIMLDDTTLVFVEVRYRKSANFGSAIESVTLSKQKKILTTAQYYVQQKQLGESQPLRFDVVGIDPSEINWVKNAF